MNHEHHSKDFHVCLFFSSVKKLFQSNCYQWASEPEYFGAGMHVSHIAQATRRIQTLAGIEKDAERTVNPLTAGTP